MTVLPRLANSTSGPVSLCLNKKFPVRVGVSILPFLAVTLLNEAYMS